MILRKISHYFAVSVQLFLPQISHRKSTYYGKFRQCSDNRCTVQSENWFDWGRSPSVLSHNVTKYCNVELPKVKPVSRSYDVDKTKKEITAQVVTVVTSTVYTTNLFISTVFSIT
jgi:hypothetical protein